MSDLRHVPAYLREADASDVGYLLLAGLISLISLAAGPLICVGVFAGSVKLVNGLRRMLSPVI